MKTLAKALAIASGLMFLLPFCFYFICDISYDFTQYATFVGGTAGPIAALAGFLFIYLTFQHQQEQLDRHDKQFERQSFENTFFTLLDYHKSAVPDATIGTINGMLSIESFRDYLHQYHRHFMHHFEATQEENDFEVVSPKVPIEDFKMYIHDTLREGQHQLRKMFRPLLSILLAIKDADIKDKDKYHDILDSHVSEAEKSILFYLYVCSRPSLYTAREYDLIKDFVARMNPGSLIHEDHIEWLDHPPYIRPGTEI